MAGSLGSCDSWFSNPDSQVSAHTGIGLNGDIHGYVEYQDRAWANGILEPGNLWPIGQNINPNHVTLSIETEDLNSDIAVSGNQYISTLEECERMIAKYPNIKYLLKHSDISPHSRPNCPGRRWALKFTILAKELKLQVR